MFCEGPVKAKPRIPASTEIRITFQPGNQPPTPLQDGPPPPTHSPEAETHQILAPLSPDLPSNRLHLDGPQPDNPLLLQPRRPRPPRLATHHHDRTRARLVGRLDLLEPAPIRRLPRQPRNLPRPRLGPKPEPTPMGPAERARIVLCPRSARDPRRRPRAREKARVAGAAAKSAARGRQLWRVGRPGVWRGRGRERHEVCVLRVRH